MSPKWAKKAHFGDISDYVFSARKSSYYMLETLYFTIFSRMDNLNESNSQKFIIAVYIGNNYKHLSARFWCYRVWSLNFKAQLLWQFVSPMKLMSQSFAWTAGNPLHLAISNEPLLGLLKFNIKGVANLCPCV